MSKILIDERGTVTLPSDLVKEAGLKPNDLLEVDYINGVIVLNPVKSVMQFAGTCKGVWGSTTDEIEAVLAEDRASWDR